MSSSVRDPRQASGLRNKSERRRAATWYDDHLPDGLDDVDGRTFFPVCAGFHRLLAAMTGNVSLQLFVDVLLSPPRARSYRFLPGPQVHSQDR